MPAVIIKAECKTKEALQDLYFRIPLKPGEKAEKVDLKKIHPHNLIHEPRGFDGGANVISWSFGGTQRVARRGDKRLMNGGEVAFLMRKYPGLLEVTSGKDGSDDPETTLVLMDQIKGLERQVQLLQAEKEELGNKLTTANGLLEDAERLVSQRALEIDRLQRDRDQATKEVEQLRFAFESAKTEIQTLKKG